MSAKQYSICTEVTSLKLFPDEFFAININIDPGTLVQHLSNQNGSAIIRVLSQNGAELIISHYQYKCPLAKLRDLPEKLFQILMAVKNAQTRLTILKNENFVHFIMCLKLGERVRVPGWKFKKLNKIECVIKYIGPCPPISHGTFFGFFILDPNNYISNQSGIAKKYFHVENDRGFMRSIDILLPNSHTNQGNPTLCRPYASMEALNQDLIQSDIQRMKTQTKKENPRRQYGSTNKIFPVPVQPIKLKSKAVEPLLKEENNNLLSNKTLKDEPKVLLKKESAHILTNPKSIRGRPVTALNVFEMPKMDDVPVVMDELSELRAKIDVLKKHILDIGSATNNRGSKNPQEMYTRANFSGNSILTNKAIDLCSGCEMQLVPLHGIILKSCFHLFCMSCLVKTIKGCKTENIQCPYKNGGYVCKCELKGYEIQYLQKSTRGKSPISNRFTSQTNKSLVAFDECDSGDLPAAKPTNNEILELPQINNLIFNTEKFECPRCNDMFEPGQGVCLRNCAHQFCTKCLIFWIQNCQNIVVPCPNFENRNSCPGLLDKKEIQMMMTTDVFKFYLTGNVLNNYNCATTGCTEFHIVPSVDGRKE